MKSWNRKCRQMRKLTISDPLFWGFRATLDSSLVYFPPLRLFPLSGVCPVLQYPDVCCLDEGSRHVLMPAALLFNVVMKSKLKMLELPSDCSVVIFGFLNIAILHHWTAESKLQIKILPFTFRFKKSWRLQLSLRYFSWRDQRWCKELCSPPGNINKNTLKWESDSL